MDGSRRNGAGKISSFEQIKCEYLTDSHLCEIASKAAGFDIIANPASCRSCLESDNPQNVDNTPMACLINQRKRENGEYILEAPTDRKNVIGFPKQRLLGEGPGTELSKLLPKQLERKGCACKDYAIQMNNWGVEGCRLRFKKIVHYLVMQAEKNPLLGWVPAAATRAVAARLLRLAIEKADKKQNS